MAQITNKMSSILILKKKQFSINLGFMYISLHPKKRTTTEFSSTVFSELLHTTEFLSTSVFSAIPVIWSTPEFLSTTDLLSTEYIFMDIHSQT